MIINYYIMIGKEVQYRGRFLKSPHLKDLFCKQIVIEKNKKTAPEIVRFQGLWSEMGDSNSRHLAPKPGAIPTSLYPDIQFLLLYHGGGENQRFFCLWSFMWSKPLLCRFRQPGKNPLLPVSQGFAAFRLAPSRIPPRHSQSRRDTNFAIPGY